MIYMVFTNSEQSDGDFAVHKYRIRLHVMNSGRFIGFLLAKMNASRSLL